MLAHQLNSTRRAIHIGIFGTALVTLLFAFHPSLHAQSSPLTVQPSTGRVGVGNTNPGFPLDVTGTVNATSFRGAYDAEAAGNALSLPVKVWLPAAGCNGSTAGPIWDLPTSGAASAACATGTNTQKGVLDFADTSGGFSAQITQALPVDWTTTGALDIAIYWTTTATTGNAKWSVSTACTAVNASATDDPAFNTANTVTAVAPTTANRVQTSTITGLTTTGCTSATTMLLHIKVFRDGGDASDTIGATARFIGAELTYRRAM